MKGFLTAGLSALSSQFYHLFSVGLNSRPGFGDYQISRTPLLQLKHFSLPSDAVLKPALLTKGTRN